LKTVSKAQKLAAKRQNRRGRPYIQDVAREPNGRISRAIVPPQREPADKLALEVRARKMGVSVSEARDARLSTYIGRLAIWGTKGGGISDEQYDTALRFLVIYNDWRKACGSPAAFWEEKSAEERFVLSVEEVSSLAKLRYSAARQAIQEAQNQHPHDNLYASLQYLVIEDKELPHMVGTLRLALNALAREFG